MTVGEGSGATQGDGSSPSGAGVIEEPEGIGGPVEVNVASAGGGERGIDQEIGVADVSSAPAICNGESEWLDKS